MTIEGSANATQVAAWDGTAGDYWTEHDARFDASVRAYNPRLFAAAGIIPGDRVLDVGCGTGWTTREAARLAWAGTVTGIDLSTRMLERARRRSAVEQLANVDFLRADAQDHPFPAGSFDVAISRTGTMFFADPIAAFANIRRALAPNGRIALMAWRGFADNEWIVAVNEALAVGRPVTPPPPDVPSPFAFADGDRVTHILDAAGFGAVNLVDVAAPVFLGDDADDAFAFMRGFAAWMLDDLDDRRRAEALDNLHATMAAHDTGLGVVFDSRAWIVSATVSPTTAAG